MDNILSTAQPLNDRCVPYKCDVKHSSSKNFRLKSFNDGKNARGLKVEESF